MRYKRGYTVAEILYALQQGLWSGWNFLCATTGNDNGNVVVKWLTHFMRCNRGYAVVETFFYVATGVMKWLKLFMRHRRGYTLYSGWNFVCAATGFIQCLNLLYAATGAIQRLKLMINSWQMFLKYIERIRKNSWNPYFSKEEKNLLNIQVQGCCAKS